MLLATMLAPLLLMALHREAILLGARDAALGGDKFRRFAHVPVLEGAPQPVVNHGIDGFLIADLPAGTRAEQQIRGPAHAFHAARQDHVGITGADRLRRQHDRFQAGAADLVDGERGNGVGQPRLERGLTSGVLAEPRLQDAAHDDFIDGIGRELHFRCSSFRLQGRSRPAPARARSARPPRYLPIGVRTAETRYASVMAGPSNHHYTLRRRLANLVGDFA